MKPQPFSIYCEKFALIELANFDDNQGHVIGEGTVPPGSYTLENCLLHVREC
jgi:hypothetical protein